VPCKVTFLCVAQFNLLESFRNKLPPPELSSAAAQGPLPLVWGFRRARRARPLNPAYVLMYHCEGTVPFDCSFLKTSLEHRCLGSRQRSNSNHMLMPFDDAQDDGHLRDETSNEDEQVLTTRQLTKTNKSDITSTLSELLRKLQ